MVATTSARLAKIEALAAALRAAGPLEVPIAVAYLSGELPQRQIGVGWAALRGGFPPADTPALTLSDGDSGFAAIGAVSGKGATASRKALVSELFGRSAAQHHDSLVKRFIEGPSAALDQHGLEGITASGPPLPVLLRSLETLRDLRLAADRPDIGTRHADLELLRRALGS